MYNPMFIPDRNIGQGGAAKSESMLYQQAEIVITYPDRHLPRCRQRRHAAGAGRGQSGWRQWQWQYRKWQRQRWQHHHQLRPGIPLLLPPGSPGQLNLCDRQRRQALRAHRVLPLRRNLGGRSLQHLAHALLVHQQGNGSADPALLLRSTVL